MAGGAAADPPPFWLVIITCAVFVGFFVVYGDQLYGSNVFGQVFSTRDSHLANTFACDSGSVYLNCVSSAVTSLINIFVLLFEIVTLGGANSPLPVLIQVPAVFFFAITWGIIIVKMIQNTAGAVIP